MWQAKNIISLLPQYLWLLSKVVTYNEELPFVKLHDPSNFENLLMKLTVKKVQVEIYQQKLLTLQKKKLQDQ